MFTLGHHVLRTNILKELSMHIITRCHFQSVQESCVIIFNVSKRFIVLTKCGPTYLMCLLILFNLVWSCRLGHHHGWWLNSFLWRSIACYLHIFFFGRAYHKVSRRLKSLSLFLLIRFCGTSCHRFSNRSFELRKSTIFSAIYLWEASFWLCFRWNVGTSPYSDSHAHSSPWAD